MVGVNDFAIAIHIGQRGIAIVTIFAEVRWVGGESRWPVFRTVTTGVRVEKGRKTVDGVQCPFLHDQSIGSGVSTLLAAQTGDRTDGSVRGDTKDEDIGIGIEGNRGQNDAVSFIGHDGAKPDAFGFVDPISVAPGVLKGVVRCRARATNGCHISACQ